MRVLLFIILSFCVHVVAMGVAPDVFRPARLPMLPVHLTEPVDIHLAPVQRSTVRDEMTGLWDNAPVQQIREALVRPTLSAVVSTNMSVPPLPHVRMTDGEKISVEEKQKIVEDSRLYRELEQIMRKEGGRIEAYEGSKPATGAMKRTVVKEPLEDPEALQMIASLTKAVEAAAQSPRPLQETLDLGIKGPAASRRVVYIPPPPEVKVSVEADVILRFWVLPDGTLGKVVPLVKGDAAVDLAAINHIKKYRFSPLPKNAPPVEMWGEISVKSVLR
jgi:hypothetical protein